MPLNPAYIVRGDDGAEYGPVDPAELREWVRENRAGLGTEVRIDAPEGSWKPWQHYPELVALLAEVRATGAAVSLPVLAPIGRRVLAFFGDLFLNIILVAPLMFLLVVLLYCSLPPAILSQMVAYSQAVMEGTATAGSGPAVPIPVWFQFWAEMLFLIPMAYYAGFHAVHGRTPAKSLFQLQVVDSMGRKPRFAKSLLRSVVFLICVHYFFGIPLLYAFVNPQRRALHDIAAGTYVVEL